MEDSLQNVFKKTFLISTEQAKLAEYMKTPNWDSVNHMVLISAIESEFNIEFEMDEIVALSSFQVALDLINKKL
jgi:acyl carrier protein